MPAIRSLTGVVVSAGLMQKTVKVRTTQQVWDKHIRKHFNRPVNHLVHDPASSLLAGDIITFCPGYRTSKHVHHVVTSILAPFEKPIEERPPVWTDEQRDVFRTEKRAAKLLRRSVRDGIEAHEDVSAGGDKTTKMSPEEHSARITDHAKGFAKKALDNETEARGKQVDAESIDENIRKGRIGR
ncbi:MAG: hypothetical protein M4579_003037 [Chaenotheca gracillima]|nr:MAG: hypothetical protein M4579_003037 [Chaenotheca gracillima]